MLITQMVDKTLPISSPTNSTFINNNLLNLQQIHSLQTALFMFSYNKNALPDKFLGLMSNSVNYSNPSHSLRYTHEYSPSFAKTTLKLFSITCYGPRLYTTIPSYIKNQIQTGPFITLYLLFKLYLVCGILD